MELAIIGGWNCVVPKGRYKTGDRCIYIPIDSVLPPDVECKLFPIDAKIRLKASRIRTIKIRGAVSQGLVVDPAEFSMEKLPVGMDVTQALRITKYEPTESEVPSHMRSGKRAKYANNRSFNKYTDIGNLKNYTTVLEAGEEVYVSEKLHGTSARYACLPTEPSTWWKKILKFFGLLKPYEFCLGSRNMQLQDKLRYKGYYDENVYAKIAKTYDLEHVLKPGEALYGEIVGDGIQKGYKYGCGAGEHAFVAYDVSIDGRWLDYGEFIAWCDSRHIPRVPVLYVGPYLPEKLNELRQGDSIYSPAQKVREGVVIKPTKERVGACGRVALKFINDEYLLGDQTEFH